MGKREAKPPSSLDFLNLHRQGSGDFIAQLAGGSVSTHALDGICQHNLPLVQIDPAAMRCKRTGIRSRFSIP